MFSTLLMLLEQAPVPTVTVQKTTEGGGAEIERIYPRQTPLLQFELKQGFIVTGTLQAKLPVLKPALTQFHPILQRYTITGQLTQPLLEKHHAIGRILGIHTLTVPVQGTITRPLHVQFSVQGEIQKTLHDLSTESSTLRYLASLKSENLDREIVRLKMEREILDYKQIIARRHKQ